MNPTEYHTNPRDDDLERLMAVKQATEREINTRLESMFPVGSRVTYKTANMRHLRTARLVRYLSGEFSEGFTQATNSSVVTNTSK